MNNLKKYNVLSLKNFIKENENIKGLNSMKKEKLISLILSKKYNFENIPIIKKEYIKKNFVKQFNDQEQEEFINKGYDQKNPLIPKLSYNGKLYNLQEHQKRFIISFLNANTSGCLLFHSVGSGKTLTAAVYSHYYLTIYPDNQVLILSPPSLLFNFINTLEYYGLDVRDKRYVFTTYEKFTRNPLNYIKKNKTLLIIDEAHNFRSYIKTNTTTDGRTIASTNKKGYELIEVCKNYIHKSLLLTGTPFINKTYDIENLSAMINQVDPLDINSFNDMILHKESINDYFKYRISHFDIFLTKEKDKFPSIIIQYVGIEMSKNEQKDYDKIINSTDGGDLELIENNYNNVFVDIVKDNKKLNSFFNAPRRYLDMVGFNKVNFVIDNIKKNKNKKHIIYTTFINTSLNIYKDYLKKNNIEYVVISGKETTKEKEDNRLKFNTDDNVNVLIISKAGTEGVDTKNVRFVYIIEPLFNEALAQQAIARAVRYNSHISLPEKERNVIVYRLIICKNNNGQDLKYVQDINEELKKNKQKTHFSKILSQIKEQKIKSSINYDNEIKNIMEYLKENYINFEKDFKNIILKEEEKYKNDKKFRGLSISNIKSMKEDYTYKFIKKYDIKQLDDRINKAKKEKEILNKKINVSSPSVDVYLTLLSLSKDEEIYKFVNQIDQYVHMVEDYKNPDQNKIIKAIEDQEDPETIIKMQQNILQKEQNRIFDKSDELEKVLEKKNERDLQILLLKEERDKGPQKYNEFFTPQKIAEQMIKMSDNLKKDGLIKILEPTAGSGNLVLEIIKNRIEDYNIDMVELNEDNRIFLKEKICKLAPNSIQLMEQKDFLKFYNNKPYDLIIMNPPFHLKKSDFPENKKDYFDVDFVLKCYDMLEEGGEIIALVAAGHTDRDKYKKQFEKLKTYKKLLKDVKWAGSEKYGKKSVINKINLELLQIFKPVISEKIKELNVNQ